MADDRQILLSLFKQQHLYANFGAVIKSMTINGFRGISNLTLDFEYPITAISGINGSGKSTIGQLAVCAYKKPKASNKQYKRKYVWKFFPVSKLDKKLFGYNANVVFRYATKNASTDEQTISRSKTDKGWFGYDNQPEKHVFYIGITLFIPKVERSDISIYKSRDISLVGNKRTVSDKVKFYMTSILNATYQEIAFQTITDGEREVELGLVQKFGHSYSENNMGFGEGRLMYMIDILENKPDNSLIVIEEPEISLHEDAQYKFIKYMMDVCNRKRHQIILSTHSSIILEALPPEGRKFILKNRNEVKVLDRVSAYRAKSILTNGQTKALIICVEDDFAELKLREAIRRLKPSLLPSLQISPMGDTKAVANTVKGFLNTKTKAIGVRDADKGENKKEKLFKLPGVLPPEKEVYERPNVQSEIYNKYGVDIETLFNGIENIDHHEYGKLLAKEACCSEEEMNLYAINAYLKDIDIDDFTELINSIDKEMS